LIAETSSLWHFMFRKLAPIHGTALAQGPDPVWIEIHSRVVKIQCHKLLSFHYQA